MKKISFKYVPLAMIVLIMVFSSGTLYDRTLNAFDVYENFLYIYMLWFLFFFIVYFYAKINVNIFNIIPSKITEGFVMSVVMDEAEQLINSKMENRFEKAKILKEGFEKIALNITISFIFMTVTLVAIYFILDMAMNWISLGLILLVFSHIYYRIKIKEGPRDGK